MEEKEIGGEEGGKGEKGGFYRSAKRPRTEEEAGARDLEEDEEKEEDAGSTDEDEVGGIDSRTRRSASKQEVGPSLYV
ncbi:hypothetical protein ILYODFUR_030896 [Ilyodon furcidens]|uniref:Uncharacterized protein n=1 Tax=Ilyodon furcidens TaxID=33524 RepID=A0ABV0UWS8_9TELE